MCLTAEPFQPLFRKHTLTTIEKGARTEGCRESEEETGGGVHMVLYLERKSGLWKRKIILPRNVWVNSRQLWPGRGEAKDQNENVDQGQNMKGQDDYTKELRSLCRSQSTYWASCHPASILLQKSKEQIWTSPYTFANFILFPFIFFFFFLIKQITAVCWKGSQRKWGSQEKLQS